MVVGVRLPCSPASAFFLLSLLVAVFRPTSAVEFLFNGFKSSNLPLSDDAVIESTGVLKLTNDSIFTMGHAFYPFPIQTTNGTATKSLLRFSTSFIFAISTLPDFKPGHGLALFFSPTLDIRSASASQHLGLFNGSSNGRPDNHIFAVEFDVFQNAEFKDPDDNHVGVDINSLTSLNATAAGYWPDNSTDFVPLTLNSGANYQTWIDFSGGEDGRINVSMAPAGTKKPRRPLISAPLNLSAVFEDKMFVGFSSACGRLVESHRILAWGFSNSDFSIGDRIVTNGLPSFVPVSRKKLSAKLIGGISAVIIIVALISAAVITGLTIRRRYLRRISRPDMEEWEQEFWPHRIPYEDLKSATKGFNEANLLKDGANGRIYRGVLPKVGAEIVVKCINHECDEGTKGFLSEICSVGRLKHRNLVGLRGWCKRDKVFMLVYDFMKNGSLDDWIFGRDDSKILDWRSRVKILRDVGSGVFYLHEGWEVKVLHRDIKASNVMLDEDMTGRLGDFGLARLYEHGQMAHTTRVVGTVGYMAPEVVKAGKASVKTDVFGFGMLILEVVCGRRPIEDGKPDLVKWLLGLLEKGGILTALDPRLKDVPGHIDLDKADKFLRLGLLCTSENPRARPTMREVMKVLEAEEGDQELEGTSEELSLLVGLRSIASWSEYGKNPVFGHPTFDQVRGSSSISVELSESDIIVDGR